MQLNNKAIFIVGNSRSGTTMPSRILGYRDKGDNWVNYLKIEKDTNAT